MSENRMLLDEIRELKRRLQALETRQEHPGFAASDVARKSLTLAQFAATTSAQLAGVLSDETGSGGGFVRATSPTLVTPALGAATATSINFGGATLSAYTTGTWTPTYSLSATNFDSITHGVRYGYYTIIGRLCLVPGLISTDGFRVGAGAGNLRISLPFTVNSGLGFSGFSVAYSYLWDAAFPTGSKSLIGITNTAYMQIAIQAWSDTGITYATSANMRAGSSNRNQLAFSGVYHL